MDKAIEYIIPLLGNISPWLIPLLSIWYIFEKSKTGSIFLNKYEKRQLDYLSIASKKAIVEIAYSSVKHIMISEIYKVIIKNNIKDPNRQVIIKKLLISKFVLTVYQAIEKLKIFEHSDQHTIINHLQTIDDGIINSIMAPIFDILFNETDDIYKTDTMLTVIDEAFMHMYVDYLKLNGQ